MVVISRAEGVELVLDERGFNGVRLAKGEASAI